MTRPAFDDFASPAQISEIHHLAYENAWMGPDNADEFVFWVTKKYPHDLTHQEAADLIALWRVLFPVVPDHLAMGVVFTREKPVWIQGGFDERPS